MARWRAGRVASAFRGDGVRGRALRGSALTIFGSQSQHVFRLASNLLLTRLLMPEAFGLMAIVQIVTGGLTMFSDIGLRGSIIQSARGDEPEFLNTAWTVQIMRGVVLWLAACALAPAAVAIYGEPMLMQLLPVAAFSLVISGFKTTNYVTANRHLALGRVTVVDLAAQILTLLVLAALAWWLRSVWALAIGSVIGAVITVSMHGALLPGIRNRPRLEREGVREIVRFGKYIFGTSIAAFAIKQSDRAILGAFLPLAVFGVYNIGWTLATVPALAAVAMGDKVLFPLYRMRHPLDADDNRRRLFRARRLLVAGLLAVSAAFAFSGVRLVEVLFDPRYALAGPVVVVMATAMVPSIVVLGTIRAAVAKGDSRSFFAVFTATAICQVTLVYLGAQAYGILGAAAGVGGATLLTYPLRAWIVHRYRSWDGWGEAVLMTAGLAAHGAALWVHRDAIAALAAVG